MRINNKIEKIVSKLNNINETMINLIERENNSYDCETYFRVYSELIYKRRLIIKFNHIKGYFNCSGNELESLIGCPKIIKGSFYCYNNHLKSLEGCPEIVDGSFWCHYNKLKSLEGCSKTVGGSFTCYNNKKKFTEQKVIEVCKVKGNIITR